MSNTREIQERIEDMSRNGTLTLLAQREGDVIIEIRDQDGQSASVEFCSCSNGGGRSPHTLLALHRLIEAIKQDNKENPI